MITLAKTIHGSRLYGLENSGSDYDYKSIFLPTLAECLLLKAPKNVRTENGEGAEKVESESFALQEFIALACRGEDVAITMLHADNSKALETSWAFEYLRTNKQRFYTKRMSGQLGYAKSQCAKYGLRADRMETVEKVVLCLQGLVEEGVSKLYQAWDRLPDLPHTLKGENLDDRNADKRFYEVAGKVLTATTAPSYALDIMQRTLKSYGERVKNAKNMGGADMKAISHSFRVGYQLKHLFSEGEFSFPLPESPFIRDVKEGKLNYVSDGLDLKLNELITEVEVLSEKSNFPEKVDTKWCDQFILDVYEREFNINLT